MQDIKLCSLKKLDYRTDEAFKRLRTNIQFSGEDVKVVAFTSCIPNDGKSFVSFNLARSLVELGKKVLFIDADLRNSVMIKEYRIRGVKAGLSNFLSGMVGADVIISRDEDGGPDMVLSGPVPPNPSELLAGKRFSALIKYARVNYDYVIIDTAPSVNVIDAAVVSKSVDGVALVVSADAISYKIARNVVNDLKASGTPCLGVVLNKVKLKDKGVYGNYGAYYGSYYGK